VKVLGHTPAILGEHGRLRVHLFQQPLLCIQAVQFGFESFLSTQDLCALRLEIVHIDRFGHIGSLPSGNIFTALCHLLLIGTPLALQRILFGSRSRLLAGNFSGNQGGIPHRQFDSLPNLPFDLLCCDIPLARLCDVLRFATPIKTEVLPLEGIPGHDIPTFTTAQPAVAQ